MSHVPSHTACTIVYVEPYHGPNEGRVIINENFECINDAIGSIQTSSATGATIVAPGVNISIIQSFSGLIPVYTISVVDSPVFTSISATSISATTFYSGNTNIGDLFTAITASVTYSNSAATPTTIGGISAGSTFTGKTMQEMWDSLLYPYQVPAFTSFSRTNLSTTYEIGELLLIGSQTFTWATSNSSNVSANTISIVQNFAPTTTLVSGSANDGTEAFVLANTYSAGTSTTTTLYTISAVNSLGSIFSTSISRSWRPRIYYGTSLTTPLTEANIEALANNPLASGFASTYSFAAGDYKYFCYPSSFGTATVFTNTANGTNVPMEPVYVVSVTNIYGITSNYNVHRSTFVLGGSINIQIS